MYMLKVTITTSFAAQPVIPDNAGVQNSNTCCQGFIPQNNGANSMVLGDAKVSATNGLVLPPQSSLGSAQAFCSNAIDLKDVYVYGTAGDVLNIMVFP